MSQGWLLMAPFHLFENTRELLQDGELQIHKAYRLQLYKLCSFSLKLHYTSAFPWMVYHRASWYHWASLCWRAAGKQVGVRGFHCQRFADPHCFVLWSQSFPWELLAYSHLRLFGFPYWFVSLLHHSPFWSLPVVPHRQFTCARLHIRSMNLRHFEPHRRVIDLMISHTRNTGTLKYYPWLPSCYLCIGIYETWMNFICKVGKHIEIQADGSNRIKMSLQAWWHKFNSWNPHGRRELTSTYVPWHVWAYSIHTK